MMTDPHVTQTVIAYMQFKALQYIFNCMFLLYNIYSLQKKSNYRNTDEKNMHKYIK